MTKSDRNLHDLAWCLSSASLMSPREENWKEPTWFNSVSLPSDIEAPGQNSYKLGIRFEDIICNWIEATPDLKLLSRNLAIHDGERTIGEFDLLVQHAEQVEHWELAVKFYLGLNDQRQLSNWFGPDPSDTLATKFNRVKNHQLKLSEHPAAQSLLKQNGWVINQTRAFVKGRLFHPYNAFRHRAFDYPPEVNENHEKGWWMTDTGFELQEDMKEGLFTILEKPFWLAPMTSDLELVVMSHSEILQYLSKEHNGGTLHIARLDSDLNEISRGFVVLSRWVSACG
ncbi:MAG: DUF1853 family protein [Pseudomonadales bacterium]|nr:DUF1853 family protein [Pseudomonadales bacterium]MBO6567004.1 DUF1853 family protein [Pseudomonadales bacterium]MBO6595497.1 DUF1853 family protein [Pseudomonadales bacterium]MBO6820944.1 DUF1853 family protein [Pseudomonadales bacterium]